MVSAVREGLFEKMTSKASCKQRMEQGSIWGGEHSGTPPITGGTNLASSQFHKPQLPQLENGNNNAYIL